MLIDTHSHIHFSKEFPDQIEVLARAATIGVKKQVLVGCNMADSAEAYAFCKDKPELSWTIGIHPHDVGKEFNEENIAVMREVLTGQWNGGAVVKMPVAVGEIGLDYFRNLSPVDTQKKAFATMLDLAKEFDLPAVVHIRDAYEDAFQILAKNAGPKIVLHCFSGGLKEADLAWSRGYITSFSGVVTYPKNLELQEVAKRAPENLFVVETDCPFLAPQKFRGQRNEPAFVAETARFIAELRGVSAEQVANQTTANAERLFKI